MSLNERSIQQRKQDLRVIALLDSIARASISPAPLRVIHELAYLSNVLAPVFDLTPSNGSLLKRRGGPYYPVLQQSLDHLIGRGMILVSDPRYVYVPEESRYRLDAYYRLNRELSVEAVARYRKIYFDSAELLFLDELAAAYSTLTSEQFGHATEQ